MRFMIFVVMLLVMGGCATRDFNPEVGMVLPGTDTAIVGLYIDKKGFPQTKIEKVTVYPGQKIIFAGPDQFDILFKDQKSPIGKLEVRSSNGIVVIEIPENIFDQYDRVSKAAGNSEIKELIYSYGIRVNGKVTDPSIHIGRR